MKSPIKWPGSPPLKYSVAWDEREGWKKADALWLEAVKPLVEALINLFHEDGAAIVHGTGEDEAYTRVDIRYDVWEQLCELDLAPFTE